MNNKYNIRPRRFAAQALPLNKGEYGEAGREYIVSSINIRPRRFAPPPLTKRGSFPKLLPLVRGAVTK